MDFLKEGQCEQLFRRIATRFDFVAAKSYVH